MSLFLGLREPEELELLFLFLLLSLLLLCASRPLLLPPLALWATAGRGGGAGARWGVWLKSGAGERGKSTCPPSRRAVETMLLVSPPLAALSKGLKDSPELEVEPMAVREVAGRSSEEEETACSRGRMRKLKAAAEKLASMEDRPDSAGGAVCVGGVGVW